ncbi:MAG TPA: dihydroneopterin aldolase [Gemmatimonadaceae bacterium]|jgi:dihydroneopterin aldolase
MSGESTPRRTDPARRRAAASARDTPASEEREITLRAMRFHALIGILEHEHTIRQPVEIDLTVRSAASGGILDYRRLYEMVERIITAGPIDYLETAADRIIRASFEDSRICQARVAIRKPHVALPGPLAYAEVVVRRYRDTGREAK